MKELPIIPSLLQQNLEHIKYGVNLHANQVKATKRKGATSPLWSNL